MILAMYLEKTRNISPPAALFYLNLTFTFPFNSILLILSIHIHQHNIN